MKWWVPLVLLTRCVKTYNLYMYSMYNYMSTYTVHYMYVLHTVINHAFYTCKWYIYMYNGILYNIYISICTVLVHCIYMYMYIIIYLIYIVHVHVHVHCVYTHVHVHCKYCTCVYNIIINSRVHCSVILYYSTLIYYTCTYMYVHVQFSESNNINCYYCMLVL